MKKLANSHSVIRRTQLKRQLVSIFLLLCIITLSLPITASASATFGSCGQDTTWSFDENTRTLTISGTGDMYDYDSSSEKAPWDWPHRLSLTEVVIEPGITSIGNYAFQYCIALTGISIPDSVTSIGSFAFNHCTALNDITIPDSVTSIGNNAFRDCQSINTVTIPNNVTNIEWNLFLDCTSLTKVTIPNNVKKIGSCAFSGCSSLAGITIPDSVKIIDGAAFEDCSSLTSIVIPNGVMSIWIQTFLGCSGLTSITIPDSVTIIGENAFASCSELQDVYYGGTKEQWSKIRIDESDNMNGNNSCLLNANIHFNSTGPSSDSYDSFIKTNAYTEGMFTDVSEKFWGAANIKAAYEYGLMVGTSDNRFSPQSSLSIAQTIVLACRLHNIYRYEGRNTFEGTGSWYQPYVDYAKKEGIVTKVYPSYSKTITRWEFAKILDASFPNEALPAINEIEDNAIPDVKTRYLDRSASLSELLAYSTDFLPSIPEDHTINFGPSVYHLYRAGIVTGSDKQGTYKPYSTITRAEAAAIITRMADPSLRKKLTLKVPAFKPVPLNKLANLRSLRSGATDAQLQQAYNKAVEMMWPYANLSREEQACWAVMAVGRYRMNNIRYSMSAPHYDDPYGFFVLNTASCAGDTRALGLCLNILGISYEHVNPSAYTHQWARVNLNGKYWVCDADVFCCQIETAPYKHPHLT